MIFRTSWSHLMEIIRSTTGSKPTLLNFDGHGGVKAQKSCLIFRYRFWATYTLGKKAGHTYDRNMMLGTLKQIMFHKVTPKDHKRNSTESPWDRFSIFPYPLRSHTVTIRERTHSNERRTRARGRESLLFRSTNGLIFGRSDREENACSHQTARLLQTNNNLIVWSPSMSRECRKLKITVTTSTLVTLRIIAPGWAEIWIST